MPASLNQSPVRWRILLILGGVAVCAAALWYATIPAVDPAEQILEQVVQAAERRDWDAAAEGIERVHQLRPADTKIILHAAEIAQYRKDLLGAIAWYERVPESAGADFDDSRFRAAQLAMELSQVGLTRRLLESLLDQRPQLGKARRLLTRLELILLCDDRLRQQLAALDRLDELSLTDLLLVSTGSRVDWNADEHLEWLEKGHALEPGSPEIRAALATHLIRRNRRADALKLLSDSSSTGAEAWRVQLVQAEIGIDAGDFANAGMLLDALPTEADREPRVWIARARGAFQQSHWDEARKAYSVARALDPYDPGAAYGEARSSERLHDLSAARAQFERADRLQQLHTVATPILQAGGASPDETLKLGTMFAELGFRREAEFCLEQVVRLGGPKHTQAVGAARAALVKLRGDARERPPLQWLATRERAAPSIAAYRKHRPRTVAAGATNQQPAAASQDRSRESPLRFDDVADRVGLQFEYEFGHSRERWLMETLGGGVAVLDFDGDQFPDLFFSQGCPFPVADDAASGPGQLFRNRGGTAFERVTAASGIDQRGYGQGTAAADFDNDGFTDLLVCRYGTTRLFHNCGDGTFHDTTASAELSDSGWSSSAAFADLDRDGDLDLYIVHYVAAPFDSLTPCGPKEQHEACRPLVYDGEPDTLWENLGDGRFCDRTAASGVVAPHGKGLGVVISDLDGDGWPEIFVGNDTTANFLFRNEGQPAPDGAAPFHFTEIGLASGVAFDRDGKAQACMGIACGDTDGNGLFDLFVTNFQDETNTYYANLGALSFADLTTQVDLADSSRQVMGWGCQFSDFDADGHLDLFVANGHLHDQMQRPLLYRNGGKGDFQEVSRSGGTYFRVPRLGRSVAVTDWNGDRAPDLVVTYQTGHASLLENRSAGGKRLALQLIGTTGNRDAEGAVVTITRGPVKAVYQVSAGGGYFAANDKRLLIGTGNASRIDRLEIRWPSGNTTERLDFPADGSHQILEGAAPRMALAPVNP